MKNEDHSQDEAKKDIHWTPSVLTTEISAIVKDIKNALMLNWTINDNAIEVLVSGSKVTLSGMVETTYEKEEAGRMAWNAPGVWFVDNELTVGPVL